MSEKIKIGEYVRTKQGYIAKVTEIDGNYIFADEALSCDDYCKNDFVEITEIVKHSKNIIELIEIGDALEVETDDEIMITAFSEDYMGFYEEIKDKVQRGEMKLLSILTHEQYKQNCYRLEEKDE